MSKPHIVIVGGGIAGLSCARHLQEAGLSVRVLEGSKNIGGRVRTERYRGYQLDCGFQVLLTAYPEARQLLDYSSLQLGMFEPGALVRFRGKFHRFVDLWRRPQHFLGTALSPVATLADKLRIARLRRRVCQGTLHQLDERPESTTMDRLKEDGFSERVIASFFKPFLGGVFLESDLQTTSRKFEFVFRMFAQGDAVLPAAGMGAIADQLADALPPQVVETGAEVTAIGPREVVLKDGRKVAAEHVVVACDEPSTAKLLGVEGPRQTHGVSCWYFAADAPPIREPILVLNGDSDGPINNLCVPSQVVPSYAPAGKSLISVTVLGDSAAHQESDLDSQVRSQLTDWFGDSVEGWEHLKTMEVRYGLPAQNPLQSTSVIENAAEQRGLILCGDYLENASIQGAMVSGRRAAETALSRNA